MYFQKTQVGETGLTDCHKVITTCFKTYYFLLKWKVKLQKLQDFDVCKFPTNLKKTIVTFYNKNFHQNNNILINRLLGVANADAPLKRKIVRRINASFIDIQLRKANYIQIRLKNKIHKYSSK